MAKANMGELAITAAVAVVGGAWIASIQFVQGVAFLQTNLLGTTLGAVIGGFAALWGLHAIRNR